MKCPACQCFDSKVVDSRAQEDFIRRRRECLECKSRFTTYERLERKLPLIIKRDQVREPYNAMKIRDGLQLACRKRPVSAHQLESARLQIEQKLMDTSKDEIPSAEVGELVLASLKDMDRVAYLRFASVYLNVQSVEEFMNLVDPLVKLDG